MLVLKVCELHLPGSEMRESWPRTQKGSIGSDHIDVEQDLHPAVDSKSLGHRGLS